MFVLNLLALIYSFILTMWYVNIMAINIKTGEKHSFILTMWYVNMIISTEKSVKEIRFILTMWYVNLLLGIIERFRD